jgi:hypothetical protein
MISFPNYSDELFKFCDPLVVHWDTSAGIQITAEIHYKHSNSFLRLELLTSHCVLAPTKRGEVRRWDVERICWMGQQCDLKLVQSLHEPCWIVTFPITRMDQYSFNSTFPGNGDDNAFGPFQNNIIKDSFFTLHVFGWLSSGNNRWMLNLSMNLDFFEWIFRCVRLDAISLDMLHCDKKSEHQSYQLLSIAI